MQCKASPLIMLSTVLFCIFIPSACISKPLTFSSTENVVESIKFSGGDLNPSIWEVSRINTFELLPEFKSNNIGSSVEFLSTISTKRESMANIGPRYEAYTAPNKANNTNKDGLSNEKGEEAIQRFILLFIILPAISTMLGVVAGSLGWLPFVQK